MRESQTRAYNTKNVIICYNNFIDKIIRAINQK